MLRFRRSYSDDTIESSDFAPSSFEFSSSSDSSSSLPSSSSIFRIRAASSLSSGSSSSSLAAFFLEGSPLSSAVFSARVAPAVKDLKACAWYALSFYLVGLSLSGSGSESWSFCASSFLNNASVMPSVTFSRPVLTLLTTRLASAVIRDAKDCSTAFADFEVIGFMYGFTTIGYSITSNPPSSWSGDFLSSSGSPFFYKGSVNECLAIGVVSSDLVVLGGSFCFFFSEEWLLLDDLLSEELSSSSLSDIARMSSAVRVIFFPLIRFGAISNNSNLNLSVPC